MYVCHGRFCLLCATWSGERCRYVQTSEPFSQLVPYSSIEIIMRLDAATCVTVVLAIALAAVYNQQIAAHAILVDMLEKRVAFLEKQLIVNDTANPSNDTTHGLAVLEALKEMNDAAEIRHLRELMSFDHRDSSDRYSFKRAKQAGFTFEAVWAVADDHNCGSSQRCLQQLREAGYTEVCTMHLGFTVSDMRVSCAPKADVQRSPYQSEKCCTPTEIEGVLRQMKAQSRPESSSFEAARQAGFTAEEMKLAGYTCQDLSASVLDKYTSDALLQMRSQSIPGGHGVWRPRELCSGDELVEMLRKLRDAEDSSDERTLCKHAARAGFSAEELVQAKFTMAEIAQGFIEAHGGVAQLNEFVDEDGRVLPGPMALQWLKAAGMTCTQARSAGLRPRHCKQIGYTFREAKEAGYAYFEVHWNRGEETPNVETNGWEE